MTSNQINYWKNVETERANKTVEGETHRANRMSETLKQGELEEKLRANRANEAINLKSAEAAGVRALGSLLSGQASVQQAKTRENEVAANMLNYAPDTAKELYPNKINMWDYSEAIQKRGDEQTRRRVENWINIGKALQGTKEVALDIIKFGNSANG